MELTPDEIYEYISRLPEHRRETIMTMVESIIDILKCSEKDGRIALGVVNLEIELPLFKTETKGH